MLRRKSIPAPVFALAGLVVIILLLWGICVLCGYLQNPAGKSQKPPDYYYSYNLGKNSSVTNVLIIADFDPVLKNYVKYLDSDGEDLEVKIWGRAVSYDAVHFSKEGDDLRVSIRVVSAVDNFLGSSRADEHVYLPRNWTYTIVSTNKNGNTTVENQSWSYTSYGTLE